MEQILTILGSVGFNWHVALANFFNFLIILFLLNKFFFKKIGKTINDRHAVIERGLNQARDAELAMMKAEEEKERMIREARVTGQKIITEAEATAAKSTLFMTQEAQNEIDSRLQKLSLKEALIQTEVEKAFSEKAPRLVAELYKKTLLKHMTEEDNNALIANIKS